MVEWKDGFLKNQMLARIQLEHLNGVVVEWFIHSSAKRKTKLRVRFPDMPPSLV